MLGVTGPNDYENNFNNNFYISYLAKWCFDYTIACLKFVSDSNLCGYNEILIKTNFNVDAKVKHSKKLTSNIYLPQSKELGIYLQQDGYLNKEQLLVRDLIETDRPLNQKWSLDRILRSCSMKQADVLQGLYLVEDHFDIATIQRNHDFYELRTVHKSSNHPMYTLLKPQNLAM
jgi:maltose phosphorylase